jgi:hypothetical protein
MSSIYPHFLDNKYCRWYFSIIKKAQALARRKQNGEYLERHHIYPRCFGGSNDKSNLVLSIK